MKEETVRNISGRIMFVGALCLGKLLDISWEGIGWTALFLTILLLIEIKFAQQKGDEKNE